MRRIAFAIAAFAMAGGYAPAARAQLVNSFVVSDGPLWEADPLPVSCLDACAQLFGGVPAAYSCSTSDVVVDHAAWLDGWDALETYCAATPGPEDFKLGANYDCGSTSCSYSAYVNDHGCNKTNFCWQAVTCGNGAQEAGEACDDGNTSDGDCCSATCSAAAPEGIPCEDGDACNGVETCSSGACTAGTPPACDDGDPCSHEFCDAAQGCVPGPGPLAECNDTAEAATLSIDSDKHKIAYAWSKGTAALADLGNPISGDPYLMCLYDGALATVDFRYVDDGGTCGSKDCWKAVGTTGFAYKDKSGGAGGVKSVKLKASEKAGKAKVSLAASGENVGDVDLGVAGLTAPVVVQISNPAGGCFEASFEESELKTNDGTKLKGKHQSAP